MNRILTFHHKDPIANATRIGPTFYIDGEYDKVAVRIYAQNAPVRDAKVDIFDDGVSIFRNRTNKVYDRTTGVDITGADLREAILPAGQNSEELAEDFTEDIIEDGSWVWCNLVDAGGGSNFTVQLELSQVSEDSKRDD